MNNTKSRGMIRKNKILYAAVQLFMEQGYEKTTTSQIAKMAGVTSFFTTFDNKEELLLELTKLMFSSQFSKVREFEKDMEPLMMYCFETSIQIHITELSEALRELYVMAYTLPTTSEYIYKCMTPQLKMIFSEYMPDLEDKDFYEMDIASSSITRGFMAKPCDMYFTISDKLHRYLECCLKLFDVPKETRDLYIEKVISYDLSSTARNLIDEIVNRAEQGFEQMIKN